MVNRLDGKPKAFKKRVCEECKNPYQPTCATQKYCGSKTKRTGCSWIMVSKRDKIRAKLPHRKKANNELQKKWKKKQRAENTEYAQNQRRLKAIANKTPRGRELARASSKRNIEKKLAANRKRAFAKKNIIGSHTLAEWKNLKKSCGYRCVYCGVTESELALKFSKQFSKLTRDHIIPLSMGGSDYIVNIQPLCISCNAQKRDKFSLEKVIVVSGFFDPIHSGHLQYLEDAAKRGKVLVLLNSDNASINKKGYSFMKWRERARILKALRYVDMVLPVDDEDGTVIKGLQFIKGLNIPFAFAKGGDRGPDNTPEAEWCGHLGIEMIYGCGGEKTQSSSELVRGASEILAHR